MLYQILALLCAFSIHAFALTCQEAMDGMHRDNDYHVRRNHWSQEICGENLMQKMIGLGPQAKILDLGAGMAVPQTELIEMLEESGVSRRIPTLIANGVAKPQVGQGGDSGVTALELSRLDRVLTQYADRFRYVEGYFELFNLDKLSWRGEFDLIYSYVGGADYTLDPDRLIRQVFDAVKVGGEVSVSMWGDARVYTSSGGWVPLLNWWVEHLKGVTVRKQNVLRKEAIFVKTGDVSLPRLYLADWRVGKPPARFLTDFDPSTASLAEQQILEQLKFDANTWVPPR